VVILHTDFKTLECIPTYSKEGFERIAAAIGKDVADVMRPGQELRSRSELVPPAKVSDGANLASH
jgi:hypothetical protein